MFGMMSLICCCCDDVALLVVPWAKRFVCRERKFRQLEQGGGVETVFGLAHETGAFHLALTFQHLDGRLYIARRHGVQV